MPKDIVVYSAGVRNPDGKYTQFVESTDRSIVDDYIEIMKMTVGEEHSIMFYQADYRCIGVIPRIVRLGIDDKLELSDD